MSDMWKSRAQPTPLDFDAILNGTFPSQDNGLAVDNHGSSSANGYASGSSQPPVLKDQRALTLKDNLHLFTSRYFL